MRILHVVGAMNRGGVETWLMHVLRHLGRDKFEIDFLVHSDRPAIFDDEIVMLGSRILKCPFTKNPIKYAFVLYRLLKSGNYDVVHSHVHGFSGLVLMVAALAGVPIRIAHSHSDTRIQDQRSSVFRRLYKITMRHLINKYATSGLAVSANAAYSLFGDAWRNNSRYKISYCGVDVSPFNESVDSKKIRDELGIDDNALVVGHVGRMETPKNHRALIDIFKNILTLHENANLLMVGDGSLRNIIQNYVLEAGVAEKVIFAGMRDDVPKLMMGAMDVFLFPSLWEGLPLTLIEAQAAGLRCIVSDSVTTEVSISSCTYLSLKESNDLWAQTVMTECGKGRISNGCERISKSIFSLETSLHDLLYLYGGGESATHH